MAIGIKLLMCFFLSAGLLSANAQTPKPTVKAATNKKTALPKLTCSLGPLTDSVTVAAEEAVQLIKVPLKVTDDKSNTYPIVSYQLLYKRKVVSEDEATGKAIPASASVAAVFKTTPLPDNWQNALTEQLHPGEELYFFDIVAKDAGGRLRFAPNLSIKIK